MDLGRHQHFRVRSLKRPMSRVALLVGVDAYRNNPLFGCVADAVSLGGVLEKDADGTPNFNCRHLLGSRGLQGQSVVTKVELMRQARELFSKRDADVALFFFAGHGCRSERGSLLVTQDAQPDDEGVLMAEIVAKANKSLARERIIMLDCCHSGGVDQLFGCGALQPLEQGVSILAACRDTEFAAETAGRGLFTTLVQDALEGGAADVTGAVTVAGVYTYVDNLLTGWDQRPLFKANLSKLVAVRHARPAMALEKLRKITDYFPSEDHYFQLDPSFEPEAPPPHPEHEAIFRDLQQMRSARLVVPDGEEHMYHAAMNSRTCSLTPSGRFYWQRIKANKL